MSEPTTTHGLIASVRNSVNTSFIRSMKACLRRALPLPPFTAPMPIEPTRTAPSIVVIGAA